MQILSKQSFTHVERKNAKLSSKQSSQLHCLADFGRHQHCRFASSVFFQVTANFTGSGLFILDPLLAAEIPSWSPSRKPEQGSRKKSRAMMRPSSLFYLQQQLPSAPQGGASTGLTPFASGSYEEELKIGDGQFAMEKLLSQGGASTGLTPFASGSYEEELKIGDGQFAMERLLSQGGASTGLTPFASGSYEEELKIGDGQFAMERLLSQAMDSKDDAAHDVREEFICPITHEPMHDPVTTNCGHTFERKAIETWFQGHSTCPLDNNRLTDKHLSPNFALKQAIDRLKVISPTASWLEKTCTIL
eukprot:g18695.t1